VLAVPATAAAAAKVWVFPLPDGRGRRDAARALLRTVLSAETGTPPESWRFATEPSGRLRVVRPSLDRMRVSLSYGHDAVALALSESHEVGVDIEPLVPVGSAEIPWSELSPHEQLRLRDLPAHERYARFAWLWTLKEAFAKCSGHGAALAFAGLETALEAPGIVTPAGIVPVRLEEVEIDGRRHALAVCTRLSSTQVRR
jgi:4'-phosphopantetheinyl transferase